MGFRIKGDSEGFLDDKMSVGALFLAYISQESRFSTPPAPRYFGFKLLKRLMFSRGERLPAYEFTVYKKSRSPPAVF
jgi:hypothetical protein